MPLAGALLDLGRGLLAGVFRCGGVHCPDDMRVGWLVAASAFTAASIRF